MWRWFLSFGVLLAAIVAGVAASWKEQWIEESIYWLTEVRGYVITKARERALKPKDTFKECRSCPEMVVVPAGEFMMGWPENEKGYSDNEGPQHKVMISRPLAIARFELTFAEWDACAAHADCARGDGAEHLDDPVWDDVGGVEAPGRPGAGGHRGIEMRAGYMADGKGHREQGQAECQGDAGKADADKRGRRKLRGQHRRSTAAEHEPKRAEKLGSEAL
jgi:formylglycine-generating enzyme required for sulfatase activity